MADEAITEREQCGVEVLNPDVHHQWHRGEAEPTAPPSWPAVTTPPTWWQERAGAHDLEQAQKRGQLNLV